MPNERLYSCQAALALRRSEALGPCGKRETSSSDLSLLLESATRGRAIPRRASSLAKRELKLQAGRDHERNGQIASALARRDWVDRQRNTFKVFEGCRVTHIRGG